MATAQGEGLKESKAQVLRHEAVQAMQRVRATRVLKSDFSYAQEDEHERGELALAAAALLLIDTDGELYSTVAEVAGWPLEQAEEAAPGEEETYTLRAHKHRLARAGDFLLAEYERLLRKEKGLDR